MPKTKEIEDEFEDELEDELEGFEDEFEDEDESESKDSKSKKKTKGKDSEDWVVPGKFKTTEDTRKGVKETERYVKKLEGQVKELTKAIEEGSGANVSKETKEEFDLTDDDFLTKPKEAIDKYIEQKLNKKMAALGNVQSRSNYDFLKYRAQLLYPDFDIDMNEKELTKYVMRFSPEYRAEHGLEVLSEAIEHLGGKKAKLRADNVHAEDGSTPAVKGKKGNIGDSIKEGILNAELSVDPLRDAFN